jgi:ElaA protein
MIQWTYKHFNELNTSELYQILELRSKVFVVEQNCVYQDLDYKDQHSWHLMGWINNQLVAYVRVIPPGISYTEASIGRVISDPGHRKKGLGKELMRVAIEKTRTQFNVQSIKIGAQCYLKKFYGELGFEICGDEYLEDGIPHIEMMLE